MLKILCVCSQPIALSPAAMTYDAVVEEGALAAELAGQPKQRESMLQLAGVGARLALQGFGLGSRAGSLSWGRGRARQPPGAGGVCGCAIVSFGEPVLLTEWLAEVCSLPRCLPDAIMADAVGVLGQFCMSC